MGNWSKSDHVNLPPPPFNVIFPGVSIAATQVCIARQTALIALSAATAFALFAAAPISFRAAAGKSLKG